MTLPLPSSSFAAYSRECPTAWRVHRGHADDDFTRLAALLNPDTAPRDIAVIGSTSWIETPSSHLRGRSHFLQMLDRDADDGTDLAPPQE